MSFRKSYTFSSCSIFVQSHHSWGLSSNYLRIGASRICERGLFDGRIEDIIYVEALRLVGAWTLAVKAEFCVDVRDFGSGNGEASCAVEGFLGEWWQAEMTGKTWQVELTGKIWQAEVADKTWQAEPTDKPGRQKR